MSHKAKHKSEHFHLTASVIIRLIIFTLIITISINYFSQHPKLSSRQPDPTILGTETEASSSANPIITQKLQDVYSLLPENSRHLIENFNQTPVYQSLTKQIESIRSQSQNFPQKQLKEVQKMLVNKLYQDILKNIDK